MRELKKQALILGAALGLTLVMTIPAHAATADFEGDCETVGTSVVCDFDTRRGSGSSCPGSSVLTYSWSWGDGTGGLSGNTATHTYTAPLASAYQIDLTVYCWDDTHATETRWLCISAGVPDCIDVNVGWN